MADLDRNGSDRNPPPTTTISTIAVQSGNTKIVIALLQSREWLELKVVELTPLLTLLGSTLQEASELQKAHDEVLLKIQSKQSPVEELLSQADQLIANQKNKGQVYVAMADSLAAAWKDINNLLQKRKEILSLNVRYHSNATMCLERTRALELACRGAPLPVEVPAIKELLARLSEVKRAMLESLMTTLQDGRALVDMLRETALEGTLDSRPAQIKSVTECAISQVEHWMEELHDRRRLLELSWQERKTQLEQCLALALLTADLKILEEIISDRCESLSRSNDQLGDSEASSQLLLYEHKKLLPEAKDFQEQALKILSATEHFSATGHFAGDEATAQAYRLLNNTSEYLEAIENRSNILEMAIKFFRSAQIALTKLDQIEMQLLVSDLPTSSTQLTSYHSSLSKSIEEITEVPIEEGYKLLTSVPGAEGVKRILDETENRKLQLSLKCTAHKEDNIQLIQSLNSFNESQKQLCLWLENIADTFLQGHQDMGSVLAMAKDFLQIHLQFLSDLQIKGTEINSLISVLPPVINTLDESVRIDIESKVENLRSHWKKSKQYVEKRTELATAYVKFHTLAVDLANIFDNLESEMKKVNQEESLVRQTEEQWHEAQQVFVQLNNVGNNFREDTKNVGEPYLDAERARLCVDTLLEHFGDRKLSLESCWKAWENNLARQKACRVQWEVNMTETTQTVDWITKLDAELYPVLSEDEHVLGVILHGVENKLSSVLPEIKRAQTEIHCRIATAESLMTHGEVVANDEEILMQLRNLEQHVQSVGTNYQILIEMLIAFFKNLIQLERTIDNLKKQYGKMEFPSTVADVEKALREHDASRQAIQELFKFTHVESQQIIEKIKQQEPELAMEKDVNVLRGLLEDKRCDWERAWSDHKINLEQHLQLCHFDADLAQIHNNFDELDKQLAAVKGQYGESLGANKSTSIAFTYFEKTVEILRQRIETFINAGEVMLKSKHASSIHIEEGLHSIHKRWEEFSSHVSHTRNLIDISIQYFTLIEEAEEWFKECSRLLVGIARRSASVHKPEEATHLLEELENFFKSGEIKQDERITKISELATKLYGVHDSSELHQVKSERKEMSESFSQVSRELRTLVGTLNRPSEPVKMEIDDIKSTNKKMHTVSTSETVSSSVQEKIIIIHEDSLPQTSSTFEERVLKSPSPPAKKAKFQSESEEQKAPFFTVPLADAIIEEGNKLIFECKVAGVPTPQISWMKDGISIDNNLDYHTLFNDGICSLTIEETFAEDSAKFTCHAINEAGFAETTATLSVRECEGETPPSFVIPLRPAKVKERSQFEFMCRVVGNPLPTVQWCKDTTCIDNSSDYVITYNNGEAVLKFDEVTLNDQAEYFCKATNRLGTESTSAVLTVEGKDKIEVPVFTVPLSNIMARAGQKIKLECEVHGTPEPQITWLHNGKIIKETRDLKISYDQHNAVLVITEAFPKDAGTYEVKAVNCAGENVSTCHVSVKGRLPTETSDSEIASDMEPCKPVIQVSLKDITVFEGMKARLDCVIVGQPEPEVIWYLENRPVKESGDFQLLFHGDRCSLIIKEAYIEDAGEYKVVAINSAGEASSSCRLTVQSNTSEVSTKQSAEESQKPETELSKPHFTMLLSDVLVTEGDTVHLKCIVKGEPVPSVNWCLNNIDIVCSDRIQCKQESDGTCSLTINHVLPSDKGVYTAKAINSVGEAKCFSQLIVKLSINTENTNPIDVHVAERKPVSPIFTELFADRKVTEGTTTKFECVVTAKPTPKIHWLFNEKPVSGKDFLISTSGPRQVLTIQNVMKSHAGRIACVAENEAGKATCLATLSVRDAPVDSLLPSLASIDLSETTSFEMKRSVFMKSVTQSEVVTAGNGKEPTIQIHGLSSCTEQAMQRIGDSPSAQVQIHKTHEYHNVGGVEDKVDQQFQTSNIPVSEVKLPTKEISRRKEVAPRFITPIMGKIVNQHEDVILEATIESYPTAEIKWMKNGRQLCMTDNAVQSWELNRARLEIKNIRLEDAGKYTCTASSTVGTASSTADVVVKKSVFPPVIGRRLQSSIHEVGQRVVLEVEITGIPEPTVTWYKDEQQIAATSSEYRVLNQGSSYSLIINEAGHAHSGKYCVKATNCGGEALNTVDLVIVEPQQTTLKHLETTSQQKINKDCAESQLTSFPFKPEGLFQTKRHLGPPPPSPSKFIKGDFRESDYESDYESRIPPIWRPYESDTELSFRPVRPLLTTVSGRSQNIGRTPTPPTEFDEPPQFSGPPRPKFEPIEKPLPTVKIDAQSQRSLKVIRPKPLPAQTSPIETIIATPAIKHDSDIILKPGSPPKIDFAPPLSSVSYRVPGGTQLETSNTMSFAESTGSSRRIVSMQQTTRVIKFEDEYDKKVVKQSERQKRENAPTPTKFVAGKARESDYESDFEGTKIRPVWVPESSMKNSLQVQAEQRRLQRVEEMRKRLGETTTEMKCTSSNEPCQFATSSGGTSQVANYAASKHFSEMTHSFKSKAQQFASDLMTDVKSNKDMVENKVLQKEGMLNGNDPQSYREESKVSEYGTKHIDPDTGLIYFKYDFGYEFGVILPGEEKSSKKKSQVLDKKEEGSIDFPVIHEKTVPKKSSHEMKTVKWEQTSESEMSDIEGESRRKRQIQHEPHISVQLGTPSPQSLSPSIQSLSPYSAGYDSTVSPHVSWKDISSPPPVSQMPVTAAGFDSVHKPPFFITPLRDIACVIGQPARFECIVQAEPVPDIMWSKDKHMLHPSPQYTTEYRNGVCRLSLHQTMPYDAGKYMCTATNIVGIAVTESTLQVAGIYDNSDEWVTGIWDDVDHLSESLHLYLDLLNYFSQYT